MFKIFENFEDYLNTLGVENFNGIPLSRTVKEIEANLLFFFNFRRKFENWPSFLGRGKSFENW